MAAQRHYLPETLFTRPVSIHVIGCGGTGSHLLPRLPLLHKSMLALGHPGGLVVTVWDDDLVSESNTVRQNYFPADIGSNKATTMVNRINGAYGLSWSARPQRFCEATITHPYRGNTVGPVDVVIGCVDTGASRRAIDAFVRTHSSSVYWIDSGNSEASGQIVIGQGEGSGRSDNVSPLRLPLVSELYPEILQARNDDTAPSCSARDALSRQALATNPMCAAWIVTWLSESMKNGYAEWSGLFFNLTSGRSTSTPVDPAVWDAIRTF